MPTPPQGPVVVGRRSAHWVVQPALQGKESQGKPGEEAVPQTRVVEPAINEDTILG